ncbi:YdcF family protein [Propionicimonas sp.]|uniref:YdcF family protein n=1 Tax=Propionicimonas sp. TaxID=1955623 RepID=UPI0039E34D24
MQSVRRPARVAARALLASTGLVLTVNAVWLAFTANLTVGTAATAVAGIGLLAWARWLPRRRWLNAAGVVAVAAVAGFAVLLTTVGTHDTATGDEDAVIVLGAAVHGSELSRTLADRLDAALAYHRGNPAAPIVVTGGKGAQENLPEADAMRAYLVAHGVPAAGVIVEDRATSTVENFANSKAMLDARFPAGYRVVFVTDEFHVFRAGGLAAAAGLAATHVSSHTPWYFWSANYLREELAVLAWWAGVGRGV